jgi:MFS family permease
MVYFSILCAYMAAAPITLSQSFYPILLIDFGFPPEAAGGLLSLRAVGAVLASLLIARYLKSTTRHALPFAAVLSVAASIGVIPLFPGSAVVAALLLGAGIGSGIMTIYYQVLMSEISTGANRGSAMALGGLGWGLSHLTTPLVMGFLVDTVGIAHAFHIWGGFALLIALTFLPLQRWAQAPVGVVASVTASQKQ